MISHPAPSTTAPAADRNGAHVVCESLLAHDVTTLFGYTGGAILPFYDALGTYPQMHHVMVRHEQAAAHAAAGYARASGRPGVCVTTSGPGATNLLTGIMDARLDSTPMVILGGQVGTRLIGSDAFQETDMMCMTATITKHNYQPRHIDELEEVMHAAFHIAMTGRPGPVYIDLPKDVLEARTTRRRPMPASLPGYRGPIAPKAADIVALRSLILKAERPFLLVGAGVMHADGGAALQKLAEQMAWPIASTILAKGVISENHPLVLGPIGMYGRKSAQHALMQTDLLLAFGCRFSDRITGKTQSFAANKTIVHVDIDAYELGKNVPAHLPVQADARAVAEALLDAMQGDAPSPAQLSWSRQLGAARGICERCVPHVATLGVHPKRVMDALNRVKGPDDIVTTGVGQHQMFASHFLQHQKPRTFITSGGAGTMGYGLPAAVGASMAKPNARVFVVDGDGSFQMMSQELATLAQEGIKPVVLVLDNGQLGMVRQWQDRVYSGRHSAVWFETGAGHPDLALLATAYGLAGCNVTTEQELDAALERALVADTATIIRILVDPTIDMLPIMPAGSNLSDFYGNCVPAPGKLFTDGEAAELEGAR